MKIAISMGFYILFLIANIEGRFLLVNVGKPDVDDNDGARKEKPKTGNNDCRSEAIVFSRATIASFILAFCFYNDVFSFYL